MSVGRMAYNDVLTDTSNQEILNFIVHARYGERASLLAVSSITASVRASASSGINIGFGPPEDYAGNLIPFSAGVGIEEVPTIVYTPPDRELYLKQILSPISLDLVAMMARSERSSPLILSALVEGMNGLRNAPGPGTPFAEATELMVELQRKGLADWVLVPDSQAFHYAMVGYGPEDKATVARLLDLLGIPESLPDKPEIVLPARLACGSCPGTTGLNMQTRSAYDVLRIAAAGVAVPAEHLEVGIASPTAEALPWTDSFLRIESSRRKPRYPLVAVEHRGYWFYVDARDAASKQAFGLVQVLLNATLEGEGAARQAAPVLTLPAAG